MKKVIFLLVLLLVFNITAHAETLKGGYAACVSEDLWDQFGTAAAKNDERGMKCLLGKGCIITKAGIEISVLDRTWTGTMKVRAYVGDEAIILWTNTENLKR